MGSLAWTLGSSAFGVFPFGKLNHCLHLAPVKSVALLTCKRFIQLCKACGTSVYFLRPVWVLLSVGLCVILAPPSRIAKAALGVLNKGLAASLDDLSIASVLPLLSLVLVALPAESPILSQNLV